MEDWLGGAWTHIVVFASGATVFSIIAHAVNTYPTPTNKYGAWILGVIQFAVGQRIAAQNTFAGLQSQIVAKPNGH